MRKGKNLPIKLPLLQLWILYLIENTGGRLPVLPKNTGTQIALFSVYGTRIRSHNTELHAHSSRAARTTA
jgi:hypothetical protein